MKCLVTGGGGFLGRYVVEQCLARGDTVTVLARGDYPDLARAGARLIRGDLCDAEVVAGACEGQEVVYHVAARAGFWGPYQDYYRPNVLGTEHVIEACRRHGVPRLVYTSSPSVVFGDAPQAGVDESIPYPEHYENPYSATKALAEQRVLAANGEGLLTVALRPHLIFGPRDRHLLPRVIQRARQGKLIQVGDGSNQVDFCYVSDAARSHLLAADSLRPGSPVAGSMYFITQGEPVSLWPWLNQLLTALGIAPVRRRVSLPVARTLGATLEFVHRSLRLSGEPRLTRFLASELARDHYYDIGRARRELGYAPQCSMAEATVRTVADLKARADGL